MVGQARAEDDGFLAIRERGLRPPTRPKKKLKKMPVGEEGP